MSVTNTNVISGPYIPNGVTTVFPFNFFISSAAELEVVSRNALGVETAFDPDLYTVSGVRNNAGGNVTFLVAPAGGGDAIYVRSAPDYTQDEQFYDPNDLDPGVVQRALDRQAVRSMVLLDRVLRAIRAPAGEALDPIPGAATRKGFLLSFDSVTGAPETVLPASNIADAATIATTLAEVLALNGELEDALAILEDTATIADLPERAHAAIGKLTAMFPLIDGGITYHAKYASLFHYCRSRGLVMRSGRYITLGSEAGAATAMVQNLIYLRPLPILKGGVIDEARFRVTTGVAAARVLMARYVQASAEDDTLTLVGQVADFDAATAALKTNAAGVLTNTAVPDCHLAWVAVVCATAGVSAQMITSGHELLTYDSGLNTTQAAMSLAGFAGAWPATISLAACTEATRMPNVGWRAA